MKTPGQAQVAERTSHACPSLGARRAACAPSRQHGDGGPARAARPQPGGLQAAGGEGTRSLITDGIVIYAENRLEASEKDTRKVAGRGVWGQHRSQPRRQHLTRNRNLESGTTGDAQGAGGLSICLRLSS